MDRDGMTLADGWRLITFHLGGERFAFPLDQVRRIIRLPMLARLPMVPEAIRGLANLGGVMLPVVNLGILLQIAPTRITDTTRVIVLALDAPVGLMVDAVDLVVTVAADQVEPAAGLVRSFDPGLLSGIVRETTARGKILLLDGSQLIGALDWAARGRSGTLGFPDERIASPEVKADPCRPRVSLVSFLLAGREYAFSVHQVQEIVRVPDDISLVPGSTDHLLGVITLRRRLVPLFSLRRLFNLTQDPPGDQHRIMVLDSGREGATVGVVVDQVKQILRLPEELIEPVPELYGRLEGLREVSAVGRLDDGQRLISILAAERIFSRPLVEQNLGDPAASEHEPGAEFRESQWVLFHLEEEAYAVPVQSVQEIIRLPDHLSRVPRTPEFIAGVVNLRGTLLPVVELRLRLGLPRRAPEEGARNERQRIVVLVTESHGARLGFIVDSVSQVRKLPFSGVTGTWNRVLHRRDLVEAVIDPERPGRMILLLRVDELLADCAVGVSDRHPIPREGADPDP